LQQEDARNRIASEIEQAFGALSESRARLEAATQGETEASEALRIETLRYHSGENTITDLLGAESALWAATASRLQAGYDITVSQARLLRVTGELAPDSFRPPAVDKKSGAEYSPSGMDPRMLAQYLLWHRCSMACGGEPIVRNANVGASSRQRVTATGLSGHAIQQGARL
jgi:hypothetical protein